MESPEDIEKALSRLMPSAISGNSRRSMEELIDGLAGDAEPTAVTPRTPRWPWIGGIAAAAAAVMVAMNLPADRSPTGPAVAVENPVAPPAEEEFLLLRHSKRVEAAVPEDWISESDGVAYRAWRVRVIDEERLHDTETGYEVLVSHPRDEVRLLPVTSF